MAIRSITPFLWFNTEAEQAANYYLPLFPASRICNISRYGEGMPMPKGTAMVVAFELMGQRLLAMNGGPNFKLDEAFSLLVDCTEQAEIDFLWDRLGDGGAYNVCGWLKDRFGLSWQINYAGLPELLQGSNGGKAMQAMMGMKKIDIAGLKEAAS